MGEHKGKIMSLKICCFGVNPTGVPVAAVFAHMCPFISVAVVDLNSEKVTSWNTKQINMHEQGLEEILRKCQNRNLVFTTDINKVVKLADLIFLCLNTSPSSKSNEEGHISYLADTEKAVRIIAQVSESNKIVVLKSSVPAGASEGIKRILLANRNSNAQFQVLSIPTFLSAGNAVSDLMNPDRVLIGSDLTKEGLAAAEILVTIYSQWVPYNRIITMSNWSAEISRLSHSAFLAQRLSSLSALSVICEESGGDVTQVAKIIGEFSDVDSKYLEPSLGFGEPYLANDLRTLIYMCERLSLKEQAKYWKEVLLMNDYHKRRFTKRITSTYFNTLSCEKISVWGIGLKNSEFIDESLAVELCLNLLAEGAKVNVYDTVEKLQVIKEFSAAAAKCGLNRHLLLKEMTYSDDPYKSAYKTDIIVVCSEMEEFKKVDFNLIYKDMIKPPYIFDGRKCLPHEELAKIGFIVKTIDEKVRIGA